MLRAFDSAYPGSMFPSPQGDYIDRRDADSLAAALIEAVTTRDKHVEDLQAARDELVAFIELWVYEGRLQTFEDRERFRKNARDVLDRTTGNAA
jgi:hypothetical protein